MNPHISLEQWRTLVAVVDAGGYAQAAEQLHKSQSALTYAVQKIESLLNLKVFELQGRRAVLTPTGQMLYRRAMFLLNEASDLEQAAHHFSAGWESVIHLAVEILFPNTILLPCLHEFGKESPRTRIELTESVLGGTAEAILSKRVDIGITPHVPPGFLAEPLMRVQLIAVAHPNHPLHLLNRELSYHDLRAHRHLSVRDSGQKRDAKSLTIEVEQRWTVSQIATSIEALCAGYGFAWLPQEQIKHHLNNGLLKPLPIERGNLREAMLYLVLTNPDFAGPGVLRLAELIRLSAQNNNSN